MPDENKTEKTEKTEKPKRTAPITPEELVALYNQLYDREWDTDRFKNPITVARSLLHYGRVAAMRLLDVFGRLAGLEGRAAALEGRVTSLEAFRATIEQQMVEGSKQFEQLEALMQQMQALNPTPEQPNAPVLAVVPHDGEKKEIEKAEKPKKEKAPSNG